MLGRLDFQRSQVHRAEMLIILTSPTGFFLSDEGN